MFIRQHCQLSVLPSLTWNFTQEATFDFWSAKALNMSILISLLITEKGRKAGASRKKTRHTTFFLRLTTTFLTTETFFPSSFISVLYSSVFCYGNRHVSLRKQLSAYCIFGTMAINKWSLNAATFNLGVEQFSWKFTAWEAKQSNHVCSRERESLSNFCGMRRD